MTKRKNPKDSPGKAKAVADNGARTACAPRRRRRETPEQFKHRCDKLNKRVEKLFVETVGLTTKEDVSFVLFIRYNNGTEFVNKALYNVQESDLQMCVTGAAAAKSGEVFHRTTSEKVRDHLRLL